MSRAAIAATKFVGVATLGLLTGVSFSTSFASIKAFLTLPSAPSAHRAFTTFTTTLNSLTSPLCLISTFSLLTAYSISPPYKQHPYLLLTSVIPIFSLGYNYLVLEPGVKRLNELVAESGGHDGSGVNGEEVKEGMEDYENGNWANVGILGVGFGMGIVGVWGDSV